MTPALTVTPAHTGPDPAATDSQKILKLLRSPVTRILHDDAAGRRGGGWSAAQQGSAVLLGRVQHRGA